MTTKRPLLPYITTILLSIIIIMMIFPLLLLLEWQISSIMILGVMVFDTTVPGPTPEMLARAQMTPVYVVFTEIRD